MTYRDQQAIMLQSIEDGFRAGRVPSTLVPMSTTYATDSERCLTNAVFVPDIVDDHNYQVLVNELRNVDPGHYFYPTSSLHTTIKNVRTIHSPPLFTGEDIEYVRPALREVVSRYRPFTIDWCGLLALPTNLAIKGLSQESFGRLVYDLDQALKRVGITDDKRYASDTIFAHTMTICRYTHTPSSLWNEVLQRWKSQTFGSRRVESISLVTCNAAAAPDSIRVIDTFPLCGSL